MAARWLPALLPRPTADASFRWRIDFLRTFVERDLPTLGSQVPSATTERFWRMLAHGHGQIWNGARFASSFGVADTTVRRYLDLLTSALVVHQLRPWHENVGKRQIRGPKVFIADSSLLHALLDLADRTAVERHPSLGASWEGFMISQTVAATRARSDQLYFWATHGGAELDLLLMPCPPSPSSTYASASPSPAAMLVTRSSTWIHMAWPASARWVGIPRYR